MLHLSTVCILWSGTFSFVVSTVDPASEFALPELVAITRQRDLSTDTDIDDDWRRTADGWEQTSKWRSGRLQLKHDVGKVHPLALTLFVSLFSVGALLVADRGGHNDCD